MSLRLLAVAGLSLCVSFVAASVGATTALAQTTIHVPADQPTIQAGINAANTGDTVLVSPGTYYENIDFKGKAITVTSSAGAATTIIDGGGAAPAVTLITNEPRTAVLSNFTITHGGLKGFPTSSSTVAGVYIYNSAPTFLNNILTQNYCQGLIVSDDGALIQGNTISSTIDSPYCSSTNAGGVLVAGRALAYNDPTHSLIVGNTVEHNQMGANSGSDIFGGPGIYIGVGAPIVQSNIIRNNSTYSGSGGGISIAGSENGTTVAVVGNLIYGNFAGCGGGGIATYAGGIGPATQALIANNTVVGNSGPGGSNINSNCRDSSEVGTSFFQSGGGPTVKFVNNIFDANAAPAVDCTWIVGTSYAHIDQADQSLFDHNLLFDSAGSFFANNCFDTSQLNGNIVADPQFVDLAGNDFHLKATSPAIDSGNGSVLQNLVNLTGLLVTTDLDAHTRELDATGKGYPIIDRGAYEFAGVADQSPTRVVLTPSMYVGVEAGPITLTATLTSGLGSLSGAVNFYSDAKQVGTAMAANGVATLSVVLPPGIHALVASYETQGNIPPADSVAVIVELYDYAPTLTLTSSLNPSILGQSVTFTATITSPDNTIPSPITLTDTTHNIVLTTLTPNSAGVATFTTSALPLGASIITASTASDSTHIAAYDSVLQQVNNGYATNTTLTSSLNPSTVGQSVTFTATVTSANGTPTGSMQFNIAGTLSTVPLNAAGQATYTTSTLPAGNQSVLATYVPSGTFATSSASLTQVVNGLPTTTSSVTVNPEPSTYGQPAIFTAHVKPTNATTLTPTGFVLFTFCRGATTRVALDATGTASFVYPATGQAAEPVGTCSVYATYQGDATFAASTSPTVPYIVTPANSTTSIAAQPNPAYALTPVVLTVTVAGNPSPTADPITGNPIPPGTTTPSGTITLSDGATVVGTATIANGKATFTLSSLSVGPHTLNATYAGDPNLNGSNASLVLNILPNTTAIALTATPNPGLQGQTITLVATVTDTTSAAVPTGAVQFFDGSTLLQTVPLTAGVGAATLPTTFTVGVHSLTAVYVPSSSAFTSSVSTAPLLLNIAAQDFTFTASTPSITIQTEHHSSLQLTLTSLGGFSGPIAFSCGANPPPYLTCEWPNAVSLAPNATNTFNLTLDTDQVLNFAALQETPRHGAPSQPSSHKLPFALASLLPLALLGLRRRQRLLRGGLMLLCLAVVASGLTACTGHYPYSTPPGTYTLPLTATGTSTANSLTITHSVNLTLIVTK